MNTSNITNYKPKDFAELLGVSVKTLQRWDREWYKGHSNICKSFYKKSKRWSTKSSRVFKTIL